MKHPSYTSLVTDIQEQGPSAEGLTTSEYLEKAQEEGSDTYKESNNQLIDAINYTDIAKLYPNARSEIVQAIAFNAAYKGTGVKRSFEITGDIESKKDTMHHFVESGNSDADTMCVNLHGLVSSEIQFADYHKETHTSWDDHYMVSVRQHSNVWSNDQDVTSEAIAKYVVDGLETKGLIQRKQLVVQGNSAGCLPIVFVIEEILERYPHLKDNIKTINSGPPGSVEGQLSDEALFKQFIYKFLNELPHLHLPLLLGKIKKKEKNIYKTQTGSLAGYNDKGRGTLMYDSEKLKHKDVSDLAKVDRLYENILEDLIDYVHICLEKKYGISVNTTSLEEKLKSKENDISQAFCDACKILLEECDVDIGDPEKLPYTHEHIQKNDSMWKEIYDHITVDTIPEASERNLMKTFISMLFGKETIIQEGKEKQMPKISEEEKRKMVHYGYNLFLKDPKSYYRMKEMARETGREDMWDMFRRQVELLGTENVYVLAGLQDHVSPKEGLELTRENNVDKDVKVLSLDTGHVPYVEEPVLTAKETAFLLKNVA